MTTYQIGVCVSGYNKRVNSEDGLIEIWVETFYVGASDPKGHNFALDGSDSENEAEVNQAFLALDGSTPETEPERWLENEPSYGSEAWDCEAEYRLACFEADSFNEPRPHW